MRFFRRRKFIDPHSVLFTVPTISSEFPPVGERARPDASVLSVSEDEWRQIEFVSRSHAEAVDAELAEIRRIILQERVDGEIVGFKTCHARSRIPRPLDAEMTVEGVTSHFSAIQMLDGMETAFNQTLIADTVAFLAASNLVFYAHIRDDQITTLGLMGAISQEETVPVAPAISRLMQNYDLDLVDWRAARRVSWVVDEIAAFLMRGQ